MEADFLTEQNQSNYYMNEHTMLLTPAYHVQELANNTRLATPPPWTCPHAHG